MKNILINLEELEEKYDISLAIPHKKRKIYLFQERKSVSIKRAATKAKISEGKRVTGFDKSYYKEFIGGRTWIGFSVLELSLRTCDFKGNHAQIIPGHKYPC